MANLAGGGGGSRSNIVNPEHADARDLGVNHPAAYTPPKRKRTATQAPRPVRPTAFSLKLTPRRPVNPYARLLADVKKRAEAIADDTREWLKRIDREVLSADLGKVIQNALRERPGDRERMLERYSGGTYQDKVAGPHGAAQVFGGPGAEKGSAEFQMRLAETTAERAEAERVKKAAEMWQLVSTRKWVESTQAYKWDETALQGLGFSIERGLRIPRTEAEARVAYRIMQMGERNAREWQRIQERRDDLEQRLADMRSGKTEYHITKIWDAEYRRWRMDNPDPSWGASAWQYVSTVGGEVLNWLGREVSMPLAASVAVGSLGYRSDEEFDRLVAYARYDAHKNESLSAQWGRGVGNVQFPVVAAISAVTTKRSFADLILLQKWAHERQYSDADLRAMAKADRVPDAAASMSLYDLGHQMVFDWFNLNDYLKPAMAVVGGAEVFDMAEKARRAGVAAQAAQDALDTAAAARSAAVGAQALVQGAVYHGRALRSRYASSKLAYYDIARERGLAQARLLAASPLSLVEARDRLRAGETIEDIVPNGWAWLLNDHSRGLPPVKNQAEHMLRNADNVRARLTSQAGHAGNARFRRLSHTARKAGIHKMSPMEKAYVALYIMGKQTSAKAFARLPDGLRGIEFDDAFLISRLGADRAALVRGFAEEYRALARVWHAHALADNRALLHKVKELVRAKRWTLDQAISYLRGVAEYDKTLGTWSLLMYGWDPDHYFPLFSVGDIRAPSVSDIRFPAVYPFMRARSEMQPFADFVERLDGDGFMNVIEFRDLGVARVRGRAALSQAYLDIELTVPGGWADNVSEAFDVAVRERAGAIQGLPRRLRQYAKDIFGIQPDKAEDLQKRQQALDELWAAITDPALTRAERSLALDTFRENVLGPVSDEIASLLGSVAEALSAHVRAFGLVDVSAEDAVRLAKEAGFGGFRGRVRYVPRMSLAAVRMGGLRAGVNATEAMFDFGDLSDESLAIVRSFARDEAVNILADVGVVAGSDGYDAQLAHLMDELLSSEQYRPVAVATAPGDRGYYDVDIDWIGSHRLYYFDEETGRWLAMTDRLPDVSIEDALSETNSALTRLQKAADDANALLTGDDAVTIEVQALVDALLDSRGYGRGERIVDVTSKAKRVLSRYTAAAAGADAYIRARRAAMLGDQLDIMASMLRQNFADLTGSELVDAASVLAELDAAKLVGDFDAAERAFRIELEALRDSVAEWTFGLPEGVHAPTVFVGHVTGGSPMYVERWPEYQARFRNADEFAKELSLAERRANFLATRDTSDLMELRQGLLDPLVQGGEMTSEEAEAVEFAVWALYEDYPELRGVSVLTDLFPDMWMNAFYAPDLRVVGPSVLAADDGRRASVVMGMVTSDLISAKVAEELAGERYPLLLQTAMALGVDAADLRPHQVLLGVMFHELGHAWSMASGKKKTLAKETAKAFANMERFIVDEQQVLTDVEFAYLTHVSRYGVMAGEGGFVPRAVANGTISVPDLLGMTPTPEMNFWHDVVYRLSPNEEYADDFSRAALRRYAGGDQWAEMPKAPADWGYGSKGNPELRAYIESYRGHSYSEVAQRLSGMAGAEAALRRYSAILARKRTVLRMQRKYQQVLETLSQTPEGVELLSSAARRLNEVGPTDPLAWLAISPADFERVFGTGEDTRYLEDSTRVMSELGARVILPSGSADEVVTKYAEMVLGLFGPSMVASNASLVDTLVQQGKGLKLVIGSETYTLADVAASMAAHADEFTATAMADASAAFLARSVEKTMEYRGAAAEAAVYESALGSGLERQFGEALDDVFERHALLGRTVEELHETRVVQLIAKMRYDAAVEVEEVLTRLQAQVADLSRVAGELVLDQPMRRYRGTTGRLYRGFVAVTKAWDRVLQLYRLSLLGSFAFPLGNFFDILLKNTIMGVPVQDTLRAYWSWGKTFFKKGAGVSAAGPRVGMSPLAAINSAQAIPDPVVREMLESGMLYGPLGRTYTPSARPLAGLVGLGGEYDNHGPVMDAINAVFGKMADDVEAFGRQALFYHAYHQHFFDLARRHMPEFADDLAKLERVAADKRAAYLYGLPWDGFKERLGKVAQRIDDEAYEYAFSKMMFTHIDYENFSPFQKRLKRLFMFPVYATGNSRFWGSLAAHSPQWAVRYNRMMQDDDRMSVKVGDYRVNFKYLFSFNKFAAGRSGGPLNAMGLDGFTPLMRLLGHLGLWESMTYRGGFPLGELVGRFSGLFPLAREGYGAVGADVPRWVDWAIANVLLGGKSVDGDMASKYDEDFYRDLLRRAAEEGVYGQPLDFRGAEQQVAEDRFLAALAMFTFKLVVKRDYGQDPAALMGGNSNWERMRANTFLASYGKGDYFDLRPGRDVLFDVAEGLRTGRKLSDDAIPGFLNKERLNARQPWMDAEDSFREEFGWVFESSAPESADETRKAMRQAKASMEVEGYLALAAEWERLLASGPQAGPERQRIEAARRRALDDYLAKHSRAAAVFAANEDERERNWRLYQEGGFSDLLDEVAALGRIKDPKVRRVARERLEAESEQLSRRFSAKLAASGAKVLAGEFPSLEEFYVSKMTPLEKRVHAFYDLEFDSASQWYAAYQALPRDVKAVVDAWRAESGKAPYDQVFSGGGGSGGGGLARWASRYPHLAALFATKTTSFDQWWALYLNLPVAEQVKLNEYRKRKGKKPFPVGQAAFTIDWFTFADRGDGDWYGAPYSVLAAYFAIPKENKRARQEFLQLHPELDAAFDYYEELQRQAKEEQREAVVAARPDMRAYMDWYSQEAPQHAPVSGPKQVGVSYSGDDGVVPERKK